MDDNMNSDALETAVVSRVTDLPGLTVSFLSTPRGGLAWEPDFAVESDDGSTVTVVETKSGAGPLHFSAVTQLTKFAENAHQRFPQADDIEYMIVTNQEVPESIAELASDRGIRVIKLSVNGDEVAGATTLDQVLAAQRGAAVKAVPAKRTRRAPAAKPAAAKTSARSARTRGTASARANRAASAKVTTAKRAAAKQTSAKRTAADRTAANRTVAKSATAKRQRVAKKSA
jgi:hypothetical protein